MAARDGRDGGVAMMAAAADNDGDCGGRLWWTTMATDDNGTRCCRGKDYDGEGQERAARDGGDSGVAMMAVAAEDGGGGQ
jgi:hypothetical protein